jgi:hypothetical protein
LLCPHGLDGVARRSQYPERVLQPLLAPTMEAACGRIVNDDSAAVNGDRSSENPQL